MLRFIAENYPWRIPRFQRDPKIDDYFNAAGSSGCRAHVQLNAFFAEYGKLFPDVLAAVEQQIKDQETWLVRYRSAP